MIKIGSVTILDESFDIMEDEFGVRYIDDTPVINWVDEKATPEQLKFLFLKGLKILVEEPAIADDIAERLELGPVEQFFGKDK